MEIFNGLWLIHMQYKYELVSDDTAINRFKMEKKNPTFYTLIGVHVRNVRRNGMGMQQKILLWYVQVRLIAMIGHNH